MIIMLLSDGKIWIYVHLVTDFITLTAGFCMLASSFCCAIFIPKLLVWGTVARLAGSGIKRLTFYWQDVPTSDPHTHTHSDPLGAAAEGDYGSGWWMNSRLVWSKDQASSECGFKSTATYLFHMNVRLRQEEIITINYHCFISTR